MPATMAVLRVGKRKEGPPARSPSRTAGNRARTACDGDGSPAVFRGLPAIRGGLLAVGGGGRRSAIRRRPSVPARRRPYDLIGGVGEGGQEEAENP